MANLPLNEIVIPDSEDVLELAPDLSNEVTALQGAVSTLNTNVSNIPNGTYPNLTAGSILTDKYDTDTTPYLYRAMPYVSKRLEDVIVGGSVVWNQLLQNNNFASASGWDARYGTVTVSGNVATVTPTSDGTNRGLIAGSGNQQPVISGHKYLLSVDVLSPITSNCAIGLQGVRGAQIAVTASVWTNCATIYMDAETTQTRLSAYIVGSVTTSQTIQYKNAIVADLTAMFGSTIADYVYTLEQATAGSGIAWLKSYGFFTKPYYDYDTGTIKSVEATAHVTRGVNAWDEEWELGSLNSSGNKVNADTSIRTKNYIRVFPNTTYYFKSPYGTGRTCYYDADKNHINADVSFSANATFITPTDAHYMMFVFPTTYGTTYKNDICINISDPTINGKYFPYEEHTYDLGDVTLRGIPKLVNNELVYDGDIYKYTGSVTRKYGVVDLGTLDWNAPNASGRTTSTSDIGAKPPLNGDYVSLVSLYQAITPQEWYAASKNGVTICGAGYGGDGRVGVVNSSFIGKTAAEIKTAMSGVYLVYELATPTTETTTPFEQYQICETGGTEEYTTTNDVPVGHETKYFTDVIGNIENIPAPPTTNGTYTLQVTVSASGNTYAWV